MNTLSKKEWVEAGFFILLLLLAASVAYGMRGWLMSEHGTVFLGLLTVFGLAATAIVARVVARSKSKGVDPALKERELRALAEDQLKQVERGER